MRVFVWHITYLCVSKYRGPRVLVEVYLPQLGNMAENAALRYPHEYHVTSDPQDYYMWLQAARFDLYLLYFLSHPVCSQIPDISRFPALRDMYQ